MVGWMPYRSQRSETGVCSRRWSRRMAAFSWTGSRFRVFLDMGGPPLAVVAYSSRRFVPFQLKQNRKAFGALPGEYLIDIGYPYSSFKLAIHFRLDCLSSDRRD